MEAVKFLERTKVIRFFGTALIVAPFINIAVNVWLQSQKANVTWKIVLNSLMSGSFAQNSQNILGLISIGIGFLMLKGSIHAWKYVLGFLGLHIVIQTTTLMRDFKESWFWGAVFLINLVVFFFIADQLVFKEKKTQDQEPLEVAPVKGDEKVIAEVLSSGPIVAAFSPLKSEGESVKSTPYYTTKKRIWIHFSDMNMWAQLMHISNEGLWVRAFEKQTLEKSTKTMIVALTANLSLKLTLKKVEGRDHFFEFLPMSKFEIKSLNGWILQKADMRNSINAAR